MKRSLQYLFKLLQAVVLVTLFSCVDTDERPNTPTGNFEALWHILDEHYCFFDYKQHEYGLDWNDVYSKYKVRVSDKMTEGQLFEVLTDMLSELRDGHVNLSYSMDYGRYWAWHEAYPQNYSDTLERRYMGTDYKISAGINYRVLDDNIGYLRYGSFSLPVGEGNLDDVLIYFALCRGLIIDIRPQWSPATWSPPATCAGTSPSACSPTAASTVPPTPLPPGWALCPTSRWWATILAAAPDCPCRVRCP